MRKFHRKSVDGFIIKRSNTAEPRRLGIDNLNVPERFLDAPKLTPADQSLDTKSAEPANTALNESMEQLDQPAQAAPKKRFGLFKRKSKKPDSKNLPKGSKKKWFKRTLLVLGILILGTGAYFGFKLFWAANNVFDGNLLGSIFSSAQALKEDSNGRTNILVFGTSEDDPGHEGGDLTDSIMVISVDQDAKNAYMISVPRDLWVKYGQACLSGYEGKINVAYECGKESVNSQDTNAQERAGAKLLSDMVTQAFGLNIQYRVHLNYKAVREAVNAVSGVDVVIDSDDSRGILDRNFDWKCNYTCYYVKWPNGKAHLDGEHALALARARNAAGGYGLSGGNFDREKYQQKIIIALRNKALSAGTLANPVAVSKLIDSLGNNLKTNFNAKEIKTLIGLSKDIKQSSIKQLSLVDKEAPLVTTGSYAGQSIVQPIAGLYDFSDIQAYLKKNLSNDPAVKEDAVIDVLNGSGQVGLAQKQADRLSNEGLTVGIVSNAPQTPGQVKIYNLSAGKKPATLKKLEQLFGVVANKGSLPAGINSQADFVIIIGSDGVY